MRKPYPSDITCEQFEQIRYYLESAKKSTHPRTYDIYDVFCAVLYVVREGCRWGSLPHDFPKWQNCYKHYAVWKQKGADGKSILNKVLEELVILDKVFLKSLGLRHLLSHGVYMVQFYGSYACPVSDISLT